MITCLQTDECVGCGSCAQVCPTACITMEEDVEGFLYPHVDATGCVACNRCEKACPVLSTSSEPLDTLPQAYLAWTLDQNDLFAATSGGAFLALARKVVADGGAVVGAAYGEDLVVRHVVVETQDGLSRIARSKYVQSELGPVLGRVGELLREGRTVLFGGTTCQAYALCSYCDAQGIDRDKLVLVDVVCLGVPTPKLLREYLAWRGERAKAPVASIAMRGRSGQSMTGSNPLLRLDFEDGRHSTRFMDVDPYGRIFWGKLASRPSCHRCPFKTIGRASDISMGDCWFSRCLTHDDNTPYDVTFCLVHSERGRRLLTTCPNLASVHVPTEEAIKANGGMVYSSCKAHPRRDEFLVRLGNEPFDGLVREFLPSGVGFGLWALRRRIGSLTRQLFPKLMEKRSRPRQERDFQSRMGRVIPEGAFVIRALRGGRK